MKRPAQKPFIVKQSSHPNIGGLKVSQAAQFLKVSPTTLRRYETEGKIQAQRDLSNNYRFYKVEDVRKLKDLLDNPAGVRSDLPSGQTSPQVRPPSIPRPPSRTLLGAEFSPIPAHAGIQLENGNQGTINKLRMCEISKIYWTIPLSRISPSHSEQQKSPHK